ncbi:MAG: 3-isopropylmalate dehydratase small subunit [Vicinamibacterales bacterium]
MSGRYRVATERIDRIVQLEGTALPLRGDNIDTDRIIPARFLRAISFLGLEEHLFEDDRAESAHHPAANAAYRHAGLMFVEANFGCGSSREHAPQAIHRRGIRAVVGISFSEIFFGNSVALGMPCVSVSRDDAQRLMTLAERNPSEVFTLDLSDMRLCGSGLTFTITLPPAARESFVEGTWDATGLLLDNFAEVERVAARLPYMNWAQAPLPRVP